MPERIVELGIREKNEDPSRSVVGRDLGVFAYSYFSE